MVVDLQRYNASELPGRVGNDVGKVAVQRQQDGPEFLSLWQLPRGPAIPGA
jgi:hypothetical protein